MEHLNCYDHSCLPTFYIRSSSDQVPQPTWIGVRSIPVEGERGSISSLTRLFFMAGSCLIGADTAILLSVEPMALIDLN